MGLLDGSERDKEIKIVSGTNHASPPQNIEEVVNEYLSDGWSILSVGIDPSYARALKICFVLFRSKE